MKDKNNKKAMVLASFTADCFALGAHWIYISGCNPSYCQI